MVFKWKSCLWSVLHFLNFVTVGVALIWHLNMLTLQVVVTRSQRDVPQKWNIQKLKLLVSVLEKFQKFLSECFYKVSFSLVYRGYEFPVNFLLIVKILFLSFLEIFQWVTDETLVIGKQFVFSTFSANIVHWVCPGKRLLCKTQWRCYDQPGPHKQWTYIDLNSQLETCKLSDSFSLSVFLNCSWDFVLCINTAFGYSLIWWFFPFVGWYPMQK